MTQGLDVEVAGWLTKMADLEAAVDVLRLQRDEEIDEIFTLEVMAEVQVIRLRFEAEQKATMDGIAELKAKI